MLAINMADVVNVLNTCKAISDWFWSCFCDRSDRSGRGIQNWTRPRENLSAPRRASQSCWHWSL